MAKASQFLKLIDKNDNMVKGECFDAKHLEQIDLTGWDWNVNDPAVEKQTDKSKTDPNAKTSAASQSSSASAGGPSDRKPKPSEFSFTKTTDRSTTRLLQAMENGEIFPTAVVSLEERYEAAPLPFKIRITMTDVFVMTVDWSATAEKAGMSFQESWKLSYSNILFEHRRPELKSGWVTQSFVRPPDSTDATSSKSPPTAAEQKAQREREIQEALKKAGGKKP